MRRNFWKATLISLAAYAAAVLIGFLHGFQFTLAAVPVFQIVWMSFCAVRIVQLRHSGGHKADPLEYDRESYGFALGGAVSSIALLLVMIVLTQAV